jgi:hypothetical protein
MGLFDHENINEEGNSIRIPVKNNQSFFVRFLYLVYSIPFVVFFWAELRFDVNMPYWDDYDSVLNWLDRWRSTGSLLEKINLLFSQHNEHRIVFTRIVALLELHVIGKVNFTYLNFFGVLGLFGLVLLLSIAAHRSGLKLIRVLAVPFFMLTFSQHELINFGMAAVTVYWAVLFSFVSFYLISTDESYSSLIKGFVFSVFAAFTSAGGLIGFPTVFLYYIANKNVRLSIVWAVLSVIIFWIYFVYFPYHQAYPSTLSHKYAYSHPVEYAKYFLMFLGGLSGMQTFGMVAGIAFLCASTYAIFLMKNLKKSWIFMVIIFVMATSASAGLSRIWLGLDQALSSRYTIFSAILTSVLYVAFSLGKKTKNYAGFLGYILAAVVYIGWLHSGLGAMATSQSALEKEIAYPIQSRAYSAITSAMRNKIFTPITTVYTNLPMSMPLDATELYQVGYIGHMDSVDVSNGLLNIGGWATTQKQQNPSDLAVILNVDGIYYPVVYGLMRPDVAKYFGNSKYLYTGYESIIEIPPSVHGSCDISTIVVEKSAFRFYQSPVKTYACN